MIRNGKNIIGIITFLFIFITGCFIHGNIGLFFNTSGLLIVLGGTLLSAFISFRIERLLIVYKVLISSFGIPKRKPSEIIEILVNLSLKKKLKGLLSLQEDEGEISSLFLQHALEYLIDGLSTRQIKDILFTEMYFFKIRRKESEHVLKITAQICPSIGIIGSIVGLISMLSGIHDSSTILKTIPIALTSTLYGIILSNFFLIPFSENICERTNHELLLQRIITEGILAIGSDLHPRIIEKKLKSFLTPSERKGKLVTLQKIKEKFNIK